jgi:plastocyanin
VAGLLALGALLAAPAAAGTKRVAVRDDVFVPASLSVAKGTTVKWVWRGKHKHDVAVSSGPEFFRNSPQRSGTFRKKLRKRGTYQLVCTVHSPEMQMTITVR